MAQNMTTIQSVYLCSHCTARLFIPIDVSFLVQCTHGSEAHIWFKVLFNNSKKENSLQLYAPRDPKPNYSDAFANRKLSRILLMPVVLRCPSMNISRKMNRPMVFRSSEGVIYTHTCCVTQHATSEFWCLLQHVTYYFLMLLGIQAQLKHWV